jgi:uncharacterized membrane protein
MSDQAGHYPLPQPHELSEREKEDAMGAYLMMFAAIGAGLPLPIVNLLAGIIYFSVNAKKSRFIRFHCHQALISQAPTALLNAGLLFWAVRIFLLESMEMNKFFIGYALTVALFNLAYFVFGIKGAVKARKGQMYYMTFFGRISYDHAYRLRAIDGHAADTPVNRPPGQ